MTDATPERLIALARELIDSWYDKRFRTDVVTKSAKRSAAEYPMIHALAAHTYRTAEAALLLIERDMAAEAVPLVRAAYECAITATWISQVPDAIQAVGKEDLRQRGAFQRNVEAAGLDLGAASEGSRDADIRALLTSSEASARNFEQQCNDLDPIGPGGYLLYRVLSMRSHATVICADQYLEAPEALDETPVLRFTALRGESTLELQLLVGSLVWAGRAVEYKETTRPVRRAMLLRAAKEAGIAAQPQLSEGARRRLWKDKREQKERARAARRT